METTPANSNGRYALQVLHAADGEGGIASNEVPSWAATGAALEAEFPHSATILAGVDLPPSGTDALNLTAVATVPAVGGDEPVAEIVAFDPASGIAFVTNSDGGVVQRIDLSDPDNPVDLGTVDVADLGELTGVAATNGVFAVALQDDDPTAPGRVAFFNPDGDLLNLVNVGPQPDMLTFNEDGTKLYTANEGEPDEDSGEDPLGGVSVVDLSGGVINASVETADFSAYAGQEARLEAQGVRIFPSTSVPEDLEPEYIAVDEANNVAFVALQENNAIGVFNLVTNSFIDVVGLGAKDHGVAGQGLDPSDEDGGINIDTFPVFGLYQPDGIATFSVDGQSYLVTANEGDARDEDERVADLALDPEAFPDAEALQDDAALGRLQVSTIDGDTDGDGAFEQLFAYGGRSFSIWNADTLELVFDSGDDFEQITAAQVPEIFNSNGFPDTFDTRSDNKGPEPEGVVIGEVGDATYAFIGLERVNGIMVYDVSDPANAEFVTYEPSSGGDDSPEGLAFVAAENSGSGLPLLLVANEVSGTTTVYEIDGAGVSVSIPQIQGAGHVSPFVGKTLSTTGVVTATDTNGFYLQDPDGDGDEATSDGIFVFTGGSPTVTVGDEVRVTGTVSEFTPGGADTNNLPITQIGDVSNVEVLSGGNQLPQAVLIGEGGRLPPTETIEDDDFTSFDVETDGADFLESLEGQLVTVQDAVAVSGTNRFGEIFTVTDQGAFATRLSERGVITRDSGPTEVAGNGLGVTNTLEGDYNPERIQVDEDTGILPSFDFPEVDVGALLGDVTGVVGFGFGQYEVYPTEPFTVVDSGLEPESTDLEGGENTLLIASYNVLNLDPNDGDGDRDVSNDRFVRIGEQIAQNLNSPGVVALQEIQDLDGAVDPDLSQVTSAAGTLDLLVDAIVDAGGPAYAFVDNEFIGDDTSGGQPGGNIRTAFLYDPERVDLVDGSLSPVVDAEDQQTNEGNPFFDSRLPLAATFAFNGEELTVVNNHFSSKGGSDPLFGTVQPPGNGGAFERLAQAEAVADFVAARLEEDADANVVVLGDLNEFEDEEPLDPLDDVLVNLTETLADVEQYTFIFQGNAQSLDHIFVSDALADGAEFDIVHVNVEFAETPERASDHEPLVAALNLGDVLDDGVEVAATDAPVEPTMPAAPSAASQLDDLVGSPVVV